MKKTSNNNNKLTTNMKTKITETQKNHIQLKIQTKKKHNINKQIKNRTTITSHQ